MSDLISIYPDRHVLLTLVRGSVAHKSIHNHPLIKSVIWFYGQSGIQLWSHVRLTKLTDEELFKVYTLCRYSWNNEREELEAFTNNPDK